MSATGCTCPTPFFAGPFEHLPGCPTRAVVGPHMNRSLISAREARMENLLKRLDERWLRCLHNGTDNFLDPELLREIGHLLSVATKQPDIERLIARAEWALAWLVKRIDFLDPGSTMEVPNHQQVMAGRVREALAALESVDE